MLATACTSCAQQSIKCHHPKPNVFDKIKELRHKRNMKPFILVVLLNFFLEFGGAIVWRPYLYQVIRAFGIPIEANNAALILSLTSIAGSCFFLLNIKTFGKRILYMSSTAFVILSSIGLSKSNLEKKEMFSVSNTFSSNRSQAFMASFSFHQIGPRSKIHPIKQFPISF